MANFDSISKQSPLVLIGCGKMGSALLHGWLSAGLKPGCIHVVDPEKDNVSSQVGHVHDIQSLSGIQPRIVVVAVKPQIVSSIIDDLAKISGGETVIVSVVAGTPIVKFQQVLGDSVPVLRAMPNTPGSIGEGVTGLYASPAVNKQDVTLARDLLSAIGQVVEVESEDLVNAVTAVSGSGPAYFFYMVEALVKAGMARGLTEDQAKKLARETFIGSALLLKSSGTAAGELRRDVTSPGGTTEAALNVLMDENGLAALMRKAVKAAYERAQELALDNDD